MEEATCHNFHHKNICAKVANKQKEKRGVGGREGRVKKNE